MFLSVRLLQIAIHISPACKYAINKLQQIIRLLFAIMKNNHNQGGLITIKSIERLSVRHQSK